MIWWISSLDLQVLGLVQRAVVDEGKRAFRVLLLQRKQVAHGLNRDKDARVGPVVAIFPHLGQHSDHVKANAVQQHGCAHGRTSGENILQQLPSHHRHPAVLRVVLVV